MEKKARSIEPQVEPVRETRSFFFFFLWWD
jgi:hypothetical protein